MIAGAHRAVGSIDRVPQVAAALSGPTAGVENYLLVGSDSRANSDPNSPDYGGIGSDTQVTGQRSDTIMVLRLDKTTGKAALLSIPRDLWVAIPGQKNKNRINSAFSAGPDVLVQTVTQSVGIPIQHYVEIDFSGFKAVIDALGGVQVCFQYPSRDANTGLNITTPGCPVLSGTQALAYARSRHYQELRDGSWHEDGTADIGRAKRQRDFVNRAIQGALARIKSDPFASATLVSAIGKALKVDGVLDPLQAVGKLRSAFDSGLQPYALPVVGTTINGNSVLKLGDGAQAVIDYFAGRTTTPPPQAT